MSGLLINVLLIAFWLSASIAFPPLFFLWAAIVVFGLVED